MRDRESEREQRALRERPEPERTWLRELIAFAIALAVALGVQLCRGGAFDRVPGMQRRPPAPPPVSAPVVPPGTAPAPR